MIDTLKDDDDNWYSALELASGSLRDRMMSGPMKPLDAIQLMFSICTALNALAAAGVVHCDLKPEHMMFFGKDQQLKLIDLDQSTRVGYNTTGAITHQYCTPEQLDAALSGKTLVASSAQDAFVVGLIIFEMLAGKPFLPTAASTHHNDDDHQLIVVRDFLADDHQQQYTKRLQSDTLFPAVVLKAGDKVVSVLKRLLQRSPSDRATLDQVVADKIFDVARPGMTKV
jgi:serine/threonine protein kinase